MGTIDLNLKNDGTIDLNFIDASMSYAVLGMVIHGSTASTARPTGFNVVVWIGSVEPTNAVNNDLWIDTA